MAQICGYAGKTLRVDLSEGEFAIEDETSAVLRKHLGGTKVKGSGNFSVVTKGALTEGPTTTQANGYFGAYLKFAGFDAIVIQGRANRLCYLRICRSQQKRQYPG